MTDQERQWNVEVLAEHLLPQIRSRKIPVHELVGIVADALPLIEKRLAEEAAAKQQVQQ
jgi:hypothetical protein